LSKRIRIKSMKESKERLELSRSFDSMTFRKYAYDTHHYCEKHHRSIIQTDIYSFMRI
jgi:hypothetical protein